MMEASSSCNIILAMMGVNTTKWQTFDKQTHKSAICQSAEVTGISRKSVQYQLFFINIIISRILMYSLNE